MSSRTSTAPRHRGLPRTARRRALAGAASVLLALGALPSGSAFGASVTTAVFSGGTGTVTSGDTLYAKQGQSVTLTVNASGDTKCVDVSGAWTGHAQAATARSTWTFGVTAPAGDGVQGITAVASPSFNSQDKCTGNAGSKDASYVVDNTGPVVTAGLTPAANAAGWNNTNVNVSWTATDTGSGVVAAQPFKTDSVSGNGITTVTTPAQSDRLGNAGAGGSVTVRVDKAAPTITAAQTKNADGTTTITFTCGDAISGIATCLAGGSTTNSRTVQPGVTVTGTATDQAGNTATASSTAPAGDTTAPTLSGAPTTQPNGDGWYKGDVTIHWTAADPESGIPTAPADTTIAGEGTGLTSSQTVQNGAGLSTTATSSPAVKIDRTAPTTGISGGSNDWGKDAVTVTLTPTDNLSGVSSTTYSVDGGAAQNGTSFSLTTDGDHAVTFSSTDKAGNAESPRTVHVKIDRTAPTIGHTFTPSTYTDGAWTNEDVVVTFTCADQGGSGLADCTGPVTTSTEGATQKVVGTATDGAGNSATDTAVVSIDKTKPTITANADREPNAAGWYKGDVTISYTASDDLSGISGTPQSDVLGQGEGQSASASVTDAAGNSASAGVSGINVDKADPVLTASYSKAWSTGDVHVDWSCTDALSGVATEPVDDDVDGEGENLTSSASCTDKAGNTVEMTVDGIRIDRTAPVTEGSQGGTQQNGWYRSAVEVTLSGSDNLSDVKVTHFTVDGGDAQDYDGPFSVADEGSHTIEFWSEDGAGNIEEAGAPLTFQIDTTAPTTTVINPISPDSGWFVESGIPFAFKADDARSGIDATYYTIDGGDAQEYGEAFTETLGDGTHDVTYWSVDIAGNEEAVRSFKIYVDTVAPSITGKQAPAANAFGWNNTDVTVSFDCDDTGSGIASCTDDALLVNETDGETVSGTATDLAGNTATASQGPVKIDKTKPTLRGTVPDANAAGWYKGNVEVTWVGDDARSKLDPASQPASSTITGEGTNLGAGPVTIKDKAGNESEPASLSGIKIDRTAPTVEGAATTQPNSQGWYKDAVTIAFDCEDNLSGVATCPDDEVLAEDGANQGVTSGRPTDYAGNIGETITVAGIDIDGTAPSTTADTQCLLVNEWCTGDEARVVLTATDQVGLSGVEEIHYSVNDGPAQVGTGSAVTVTVPLTGTGLGNVSYWAVDKAGNVESSKRASLKWDNIKPVVSYVVDPTPNADGWNNSNATVKFSATDEDGGSGIVAGSITPDVLVTEETAGRVVHGEAKDIAGNVGGVDATVKLDKTAPGISGAINDGVVGDNGWYRSPVTVHYACNDGLSGVKTCSSDDVLTANGEGQSRTGTAVDKAGNTATATVSGIKIDQEAPTLTTAGVNVQGGTYTVGSVPAATCTASDSFSGIASCTVTVTGGNANGVGTFDYRATAKDKAGNTTTINGTYKVVYRFDGFLQPINDTAHQVGVATSIFKAGSTVPAKFQLKKADGTVVQATTTPTWLTPVKGSAMSAPVDETVYAGSIDSGSTYRWDTPQYIYNWKTDSKSSGNYWQIGVRLDDGQTYYVNIGLR